MIQSSEGHYWDSNPQVTASFGAVNSIAIAFAAIADLTFIDAGASSVTGDVTTAGGLILDPFSGDGGSSLTIGGVLGTHFYYSGSSMGLVQIGPSDGTLSAASTIKASSIAAPTRRYSTLRIVDGRGSP